MKTFAEFTQLNEGGEKSIFRQKPKQGSGPVNPSTGDWKKTPESDKLASNRIPATTRGHAESTIRAIGDHFRKHHGVELFGKDHHALKTGSAYAGSSKVILARNKDGSHVHSHKEIAEMGKTTSGDHDVLYNDAHHHLVTPKALHNHLPIGTDLGHHVVHDHAGSGTQTHIALKHKKTGEIHQLDLVPEKYKDHEPDKFAQMAHASHPADLRSRISGDARAKLTAAVADGASDHPGKGPVVSPTGKALKNQPDRKGAHTIGTYGMRNRYEKHPSGGVTPTKTDHKSNTRDMGEISKRLDMPENAVGHFTNTVKAAKGWDKKRLVRTLKGFKGRTGENNTAHDYIKHAFSGHKHEAAVHEALS